MGHRYTHSKEDETILVLEGELVALLDDKRYDVKAGSWVHMPRGVSHSFKNQTDKPVRMILTYSPGGFEQWFLDVGTPAKRTDAEPPKPGPDDIKKAISAAEKYGVTFLGVTQLGSKRIAFVERRLLARSISVIRAAYCVA